MIPDLTIVVDCRHGPPPEPGRLCELRTIAGEVLVRSGTRTPAPVGEWTLSINGDEMVSRALVNALPELCGGTVARWLLPRRSVHPTSAHWLRSTPWAPVEQPRLVRSTGATIDRAELPIYGLEFVRNGLSDRWCAALRDEVLHTVDRTQPAPPGFAYWLPERAVSPDLVPLAPADAAALDHRGPPSTRPGVRSDFHDDLTALTMPGLSREQRRETPVLEDFCPPVSAGIPKIVHQVWLGRRPIPAAFHRYRRTWRQHHPSWKCQLWTEDTLPPLRCAPVLCRARTFAEQADVVRLELLSRFGGVYADMDFECRRSLDSLVERVGAFAGLERRGWVGNAILGATAGHPAFTFALTQAMALVGQGRHAVESTGPFLLTRILAEFPSVALVAPHLLYPIAWDDRSGTTEIPTDAYAVHHWALSHLDSDGDDVAGTARSLTDKA